MSAAPPPLEARPPRTALTLPTRPACLALVLVLLGTGVLLSRIGPATSTETRYSAMGREMLESGDWVVPRLNGAPLLEKPPFEYWSMAATCALLGANDLSTRVPSLLAGLLTLFVAAAAARRNAPEGWPEARRREAGALAALALGTMPAFLAQAYTISTDAWLVLVTTTAGWALLETLRTPGRVPLRWTLLLHGALGLGMLVKGPLALGLLLGVALATSALRRDARLLRPFVHPLGLALFAALAVPWYLAVEARMPGTLSAFVQRRLFGGLASSADFHARPAWIVWLPLLGTAPWLAALPAALRSPGEGGSWRSGPRLPLIALALAAPVLFTFSASRLWSYASPAFPWIAVLVAIGSPLVPGPDGTHAARWLRGLRLGTVLMACAALGLVGVAVHQGSAWTPAAGALLGAAAVAVVLLVLTLCRRTPSAPTAAAVSGAALLAFTSSMVVLREPSALPALKPLWSAVEAHRRGAEELGAVLTYTGDWGLLPWYAHAPVHYFDYPSAPMLVRPEQFRPDLYLPESALGPWFSAHERRWLLVRTKEVERRLGSLARWTVAENGGYSILTNLPAEDDGHR